MRLVAFAAVVSVALLAAPGVAAAKGPVSVSVSGPGLAAPIALDGEGESDAQSPLALLTTDTGVFNRAHRRPPAGDLGPRYIVRMVFPRHSTGKPAYVVKQRLYPYAARGPVVFTAAGQRLFDDETRTLGGWSRVPQALVARLVELGFPARAVTARATTGPEGRAGGGGPSPLWAIAGLAMLAVVGAVVVSRATRFS